MLNSPICFFIILILFFFILLILIIIILPFLLFILFALSIFLTDLIIPLFILIMPVISSFIYSLSILIYLILIQTFFFHNLFDLPFFFFIATSHIQLILIYSSFSYLIPYSYFFINSLVHTSQTHNLNLLNSSNF